jgi:hypothetical protein
MKSQAFEAPDPESLQSKSPFARKIESPIKALRVLRGRLCEAICMSAFFVPKTDIRFPGEPAYSGARALRNGISEIIIRPLNGSFSSKIK